METLWSMRKLYSVFKYSKMVISFCILNYFHQLIFAQLILAIFPMNNYEMYHLQLGYSVYKKLSLYNKSLYLLEEKNPV